MRCADLMSSQAKKMAKMLIDAGADLSTKTSTGATALDLATWSKSPSKSVIQDALTWDCIDYKALIANMTISQFNQWIANKQIQVVRNIIRAGFDINNIGKEDTPPLVVAAKADFAAGFRLLVRNGADPSLHGSSTGVLANATRLTVDEVEMLVKKGAKINEYVNGYTPITMAAELRDFQVALYLLEMGADPNLVKGGFSPMYRAVQNNDLQMVVLLMDYDADPNCKIYVDAKTPLDEANEKGYIWISRVLGRYAEIDDRDSDGHTPLFKACMKGNRAQIKELLQKGASTQIVDNDKIKLSDIAALRSTVAPLIGVSYKPLLVKNLTVELPTEMRHLLMHYKLPETSNLDIHMTDYRGDSLLHHAVLTRDLELIERLLEDGAEPLLENKVGETPVLLAMALAKDTIYPFFEERGIEPKNEKPLQMVENQTKMYNRIEAFEKAMSKRVPSKGLIVHSDGGGQYVSQRFRNRLGRYGYLQSMTRKENHYDNAFAESLFSRFKAELLDGGIFYDLAEARLESFDYIDCYYNPIRKHSSLGNKNPLQFEREGGC